MPTIASLNDTPERRMAPEFLGATRHDVDVSVQNEARTFTGTWKRTDPTQSVLPLDLDRVIGMRGYLIEVDLPEVDFEARFTHEFGHQLLSRALSTVPALDGDEALNRLD